MRSAQGPCAVWPGAGAALLGRARDSCESAGGRPRTACACCRASHGWQCMIGSRRACSSSSPSAAACSRWITSGTAAGRCLPKRQPTARLHDIGRGSARCFRQERVPVEHHASIAQPKQDNTSVQGISRCRGPRHLSWGWLWRLWPACCAWHDLCLVAHLMAPTVCTPVCARSADRFVLRRLASSSPIRASRLSSGRYSARAAAQHTWPQRQPDLKQCACKAPSQLAGGHAQQQGCWAACQA